MAVAAESLENGRIAEAFDWEYAESQFTTHLIVETAQSQEVINRRTDDIIFNVRHLHANIADRELGTFNPGVEEDVLEQDITELAEADIHALGAVVVQDLDETKGQYMSLGVGTYDNAVKGYEALDLEDGNNWIESGRRLEEVIDESHPLDPTINAGMRAGGVKVFASPESTHNEEDLDVTQSFGYDGRTMLRFQRLSPDGKQKTMQSFSLFDMPAAVWATYLGDRFGAHIEPTALDVMRFCNDMPLQHGSSEELLQDLIGGLIPYLDEDGQRSAKRQLESFLKDQEALRKDAEYYGKEKLALEKELALSYGTAARPAVMKLLESAFPNLKGEDREQLAARYRGGELQVDDYVAELVVKIKTLMVDNRAGLATLNEYTVKRVASKIGLEATIELASRERLIQQNPANESLTQSTERTIAESGVSCGGNCATRVDDLLETMKASEAGLKGTIYKAESLNKGSKCGCAKKNRKPNVLSDGKNVVCTTCGEGKVNGKSISLF